MVVQRCLNMVYLYGGVHVAEPLATVALNANVSLSYQL